MDRSDILRQIIESNKSTAELLIFLKEIPKSERKELLPTLKELSEKYFKYRQTNNANNWGYSYAEKYRTHLKYAGFVCTDSVTQFRNNIGWHTTETALNDFVIYNILPWHKPKWYQRTVNRLDSSWSLDYKKLLYLIRNKYLKPSDELITIIFERFACTEIEDHKKNKFQRKISYEYVEKEEIALHEHFWFLFKYPSNIHGWSNTKGNDWDIHIPHFISKGLIARNRVIENVLLTCTKGFNNSLSRWFFKLLDILDVTPLELLEYQNHLFTCLNSESKSAIKYALDSIKKLVKNKDFDRENFIDIAPLLLTSETKMHISSTIMILERAVSADNKLSTIATEAMIDSLISQDEKIQTRIAKNIVKNLPITRELQEQISIYKNELLVNTKEILSGYIIETESYDDHINTVSQAVDQSLLNDKKIEIPEEFDEIVYFLSRLFTNHEALDTLILPDVLVNLDKVITQKNADKISPAIISALQHISFFWMGLDELKAKFLNDYALEILERFPSSLPNRESFLHDAEANNRGREEHHKKSLKSASAKSNTMMIKRLFTISNKLRNNGLKLLSTPSHHPCWLSIENLIHNILQYQDANIELDTLDFQIAISRLHRTIETSPELHQSISMIKDQNIKSIINYCITPTSIKEYQIDVSNVNLYAPRVMSVMDQGAKELIDHLLQNSIDVLADYSWNINIEGYVEYGYDYKKNQRNDKNKERAQVTVSRFEDSKISIENDDRLNTVKKVMGSLFRKMKGNSKNVFSPLHGLSIMKTRYRYDHGIYSSYDIAPSMFRILMLSSPNHFNIIAGQMLDGFLQYGKCDSESQRHIIKEYATMLNEIWRSKDMPEIVYMTVACIFLCDHKISRELMGGWWTTFSAHQLIAQRRLGNSIGTLLYYNYGPVKRYTDVITDYMYGVDKDQDVQLHELLSSIIAKMNPSPITNTKKILNFYVELSLKYNLEIPEETRIILNQWKVNKSLASLINRI